MSLQLYIYARKSLRSYITGTLVSVDFYVTPLFLKNVEHFRGKKLEKSSELMARSQLHDEQVQGWIRLG